MRACLAVVLLAGCWQRRHSANEYYQSLGANVALDRDTSVAVEGRSGFEGRELTATASVDRVEDQAHSERRVGGVLTVGLTQSLSGLVSDDHRTDRLLDVGFDGGFGLGLTRDGELSKAYAGAWAELGFGQQSGLGIRIGLRWVSYHEWANETLALVGVQWVRRRE